MRLALARPEAIAAVLVLAASRVLVEAKQLALRRLGCRARRSQQAAAGLEARPCNAGFGSVEKRATMGMDEWAHAHAKCSDALVIVERRGGCTLAFGLDNWQTNSKVVALSRGPGYADPYALGLQRAAATRLGLAENIAEEARSRSRTSPAYSRVTVQAAPTTSCSSCRTTSCPMLSLQATRSRFGQS